MKGAGNRGVWAWLGWDVELSFYLLLLCRNFWVYLLIICRQPRLQSGCHTSTIRTTRAPPLTCSSTIWRGSAARSPHAKRSTAPGVGPRSSFHCHHTSCSKESSKTSASPVRQGSSCSPTRKALLVPSAAGGTLSARCARSLAFVMPQCGVMCVPASIRLNRALSTPTPIEASSSSVAGNLPDAADMVRPAAIK